MPFGFINLFHQYLLYVMCIEPVLWGFNKEAPLLRFSFTELTSLGREHLKWKLIIENNTTGVAYMYTENGNLGEGF